uniref:23 kDa jasmonate-induced protein-like n=1 Tax=Chenopodium quinoa TaxID=63459 RepID=A0A803NF18_CHEQI
MGSAVFGSPVTMAMLREMPEYKGSNSIGQKDLAKVALEKVNAEGKAANARNFVEKLQSRFGADYVSTMCLVYNATGDNMTYVVTHDWHGRLCESAYPVIIANGQWGAFLHGQYYGNDDRESRAGIVYSALNNQGKNDIGSWVLIVQPKVYVEIREAGHYDLENTGAWYALNNLLGDGKLVHKAYEEGGFISGSIGNTAKPIFEAVLTCLNP